jgi:hypothetical protein
MKYGITLNLLGCTDFIELTEEQFDEIKKAKMYLVDALLIEEKYAYILENYCEYEIELLKATVNEVVFKDLSWDKIVNDIHTINRRIMNYLSACRLYHDQIKHHFHNIYGKHSQQVMSLEAQKSKEYDSNIGYRILEAIRNHSQHYDIPVNAVTYESKTIDSNSTSKGRNIIIPWILVARLKINKDFKPKVLKELEEMGNKIDIRPFIRSYLESIGNIHRHIRQILNDDIPKWEQLMKYVKERFYECGGTDPVGLCIFARDKHNNHQENVDIFDDIINRRIVLGSKNNILPNFASEYVTNEITQQK